MKGVTMGLDLAQERELTHSLLDRLPEERLSHLRRLLQTMIEPPRRSDKSVPDPSRKSQKGPGADHGLVFHGVVFGSVVLGEGVTREEILCEFGI